MFNDDDPFTGINPDQASQFSDVEDMLRRQMGGALGDDAATAFLQPQVKAASDGSGLVVYVKCAHRCISLNQVSINWPELVFLSQGAAPPDWYYDRGTFRPQVSCRCGAPITIGVTPDECAKAVRSGISAGRLPAPQAQQWLQQAQQVAAQQNAQRQTGMGMMRR